MIKSRLKQRDDAAGAGHFGAPRGSRTHNGIDFSCMPDGEIESPVDGEVTKIGFPYGSGPGGADPETSHGMDTYRYVEITSDDGNRHRIFYIKHVVMVGQDVEKGQVVGIAQDVSKRYPQYPEMTPHVHYEIKLPDNSFIDPGDQNV
jgi:murein DD-endopeptidase MepM/ murein hydrolase activator NlpD